MARQLLQRSTKLTTREIDKLREVIRHAGFAPSPLSSEHEELRVMQGGISLIVYKSGNMVYEDNPATMKLVDQVLVLPQDVKYDYELGSDEAGKGEWYGPLVVVCVSVKSADINDLRRIGVKDSKTLSPRGIKIIANELKKNSNIVWKTMLLPPAEYNALILQYKNERKNLNDLLAWAHSAAIMKTVKGLGIISDSAIRVTIDKFAEDKMNLSLQKMEQKGITIVQKIGGEEDIPVAAASIIAKDLFEEEVGRMCQTYGMNFRIMETTDVPKDILNQVAKMHFKNVSATESK